MLPVDYIHQGLKQLTDEQLRALEDAAWKVFICSPEPRALANKAPDEKPNLGPLARALEHLIDCANIPLHEEIYDEPDPPDPLPRA